MNYNIYRSLKHLWDCGTKSVFFKKQVQLIMN